MAPIGWKDRVVVITGGSAGIGAALAREIGRRGGSVVIAARRADKLADVAASMSAPCATVQADVTRREDVARVLSSAIARYGKVDAWVNNAGRGISRNPVGSAPVFTVTNPNTEVVQQGVPIFGGVTATPPFGAYAISQQMRTPYVQNFNVNVQRQLTRWTMLQVGYVGNQAR